MMLPLMKSCDAIKKRPEPVLTKNDIPYRSTLVFNAGVTKYNGKYVMVFRNDYGEPDNERDLAGTNIGLAFSDDGIKWKVEPNPCFTLKTDEINRAYDPRLTVIDGKCYMCFAIDTKHGVCGGIAETEDFEHFKIHSMTVPDNRNMVLFPEKINGLYTRLERPMPVYSRGHHDRFDTWISSSPDLRFWGDSKLLLSVEDVPYANDKIGPGAPPIKTEKGWLATFHAVDVDETRGENGWGQKRWIKRYSAGIMMLDIGDPSKVLGVYKEPFIAPELPFEVEEGYRTSTVFPGGMILEPDGEVKIYYGAADAVECLATADVNELIKLCIE